MYRYCNSIVVSLVFPVFCNAILIKNDEVVLSYVYTSFGRNVRTKRDVRDPVRDHLVSSIYIYLYMRRL